MSADSLKREAELRAGVIDQLITASVLEGSPAREEFMNRWRHLVVQPCAGDVGVGNV